MLFGAHIASGRQAVYTKIVKHGGASTSWGRNKGHTLFKMSSFHSDKRKGKNLGQNRCLSCGTSENIGRRKYCSLQCRQRLRQKLNVRTGLLKALNIRYGTFYFTDRLIVMDVLPYDSQNIYSFIFKRTGDSPADDFSRLANVLGSAWWAERKRTARNYLASRYVLSHASRNCTSTRSVKPMSLNIPAVNGKSLLHLKLDRSVLKSTELEKKIKQAYRREAKKHHPDRGGDNAAFRKIHQAYEELIRWSENPIFFRRRRFTDKWFYDGDKNKWVQPGPVA